MTYYDVKGIKRDTDILTIVKQSTTVKKIASTKGDEYAGPCPFCGGKDRFHVQPNHPGGGKWMCRKCTSGIWGDVISYVMKSERCGFNTACAKLVNELNAINTITHERNEIFNQIYTPPSIEWQKSAITVVQQCEQDLWKSQNALDFLHDRGLTDETISHFRLGFNPPKEKKTMGRRFGNLFIPAGLTIPCITHDYVWYIKIRTIPGIQAFCNKCKKVYIPPEKCPGCNEETRYAGIKGNRTAAIFNGDSLFGARSALFCEGEFDCMIAFQELHQFIPCVTLGSANNQPDLLVWGLDFLNLQKVYCAYDNDQAGDHGSEILKGIFGTKVVRTIPEQGKDLNDLFLQNRDLVTWFRKFLPVVSDGNPSPAD